MQKCLITGATGLVGQSLLPKLAQKYEVISLGKTQPSNYITQHVAVDFSSDWDIQQLPEKVDLIIHLAQSAHFRDFPGKASQVFYTNTLSTMKLLDYAHQAGVSKFMYASSGGVYGKGNQLFGEEATIVSNNQLGFYLGTKLSSEVLLESYQSFFDIDVLRFFFVYGEHQQQNMLIPRLINSVQQGLPITLQGEEGLKINPIYVEDATDALMALTTKTGYNQINIAGNEVLSLKQIAEIIQEVTHQKAVFQYAEGEVQHLMADTSKMHRLATKPTTSFAKGVKILVENKTS